MKPNHSIQWNLLILLAVLCLSAAFPSGVVEAASLAQDPPPNNEAGEFGVIAKKRVEIRYTRTQRFLEREQREYERAVEALPKLEERINTLQEKGTDTTVL